MIALRLLDHTARSSRAVVYHARQAMHCRWGIREVLDIGLPALYPYRLFANPQLCW